MGGDGVDRVRDRGRDHRRVVVEDNRGRGGEHGAGGVARLGLHGVVDEALALGRRLIGGQEALQRVRGLVERGAVDRGERPGDDSGLGVEAGARRRRTLRWPARSSTWVLKLVRPGGTETVMPPKPKLPSWNVVQSSAS